MRLKASKNKRAESPIELYTSLTYNVMDAFEWDENKRLINLKKHGIDFVDIVYIFHDPKRKEIEATRNNELRRMVVGYVNGSMLSVVYIFRKNKQRIISARRASIKERKDYEFSN